MLSEMTRRFTNESKHEESLVIRTNRILRAAHYKVEVHTFIELEDAMKTLDEIEFPYMNGFNWAYNAYGHYVELAEKILTILQYVELNVADHKYDLQNTIRTSLDVIEKFRLGFFAK
jgi:hypothetical protein